MNGAQQVASRRARLASEREARSALMGRPWPKNPAQVFAAWARTTLIVPDGPMQGQPFEVERWQSTWLRGALADGVLEAALSVARKNGKTSLIGGFVLCCLVGPLARPGWRGLVCSLTGVLAKELLRAIRTMADAADLGDVIVTSVPWPGKARSDVHGTECTFLASDKGAGHAAGADLAIIDEAGLLPEDARPLWNAMLSAVGGRDGRLWGISIRGDGPMFRELLGRGAADGVHVREYAAKPGARSTSKSAWAAANPGLGSIKPIGYMEKAATRAASSAADEPDFRAQELNLPGIARREMIVSVDAWAQCARGELPERAGACYLGVDLGQSASMTCAVAFWPATMRVDTWGAFGAIPDLEERGELDGVGDRYVRMAAAGELLTLGKGRVTPVVPFLQFVMADLSHDGVQVVLIGLDRFRQAEGVDALQAAGLAGVPVAWRGTGAGPDGHTDVRLFQRAVLGGKLRPRRSLMLESAIEQSQVQRDTNGNPSLDKSKSKSRIDALQAAVIAVSLGLQAAGVTDVESGEAGDGLPQSSTVPVLVSVLPSGEVLLTYADGRQEVENHNA